MKQARGRGLKTGNSKPPGRVSSTLLKKSLYGRTSCSKWPVQYEQELDWLRPGTTIAGLLHLASAREDKVEVLLEKKITSIAYEQIETADGALPVLRPFSQIGGRMTASIAARLLQNNWGGKGMLLGGVPGVPPAEVLILGGGVVGYVLPSAASWAWAPM